MADREIDGLVAERIFNHKGVGYYGPTKEHGGHQDYALMSKDEAKAAYIKYWLGGEGKAKGEDQEPDLCYWRNGWGPVFVGDYSTSLDLAATVEARLKELGRWPAYIKALVFLVAPDAEHAATNVWYLSVDDLGAVASATARQRMEAALACVEGRGIGS